MDLKQLEYFQWVAKSGGFSKAAAVLSVTQPALSRAIRQLEVELHQNLLVRNGRGVTLTDEGQLLFERATDILDQVYKTQQEITDLRRSPSGRVILGCSHAVGADSIAGLVKSFGERFPRASLEIMEVKGWTAYDWLISGRLDIGILYDPPPSPAIEVTPLREVPLYLVSAKATTTLKKNTRVKVSQLGEFPMILPANRRAINLVIEKASAAAGVKLNTVLRVEGSKFIVELVHRGHGCTILAEHSVMENRCADKLQMNEIVSPRLTWTLTMATSAHRRLTSLTQQTARMVLDLLKRKRG